VRDGRNRTLGERLADYPKVTLSGLDILNITETECVAFVADAAADGVGGWLLTPNLDIVRKCSVDPDILQICQRADLRVADGMPLVWASRLQGTPLPERVSGSNLIEPIARACAERGLRVFLLGGAPGVVERTREAMRETIPDLEIADVYCPPFGFDSDDAELARIARTVRESRADLVFVALSFPKGERLIERLRPELPDAWWIGVGISFSFVSGDVRRAPVWMQKSGTEWLFRLSQEPGRLARRYLVEDLPFSGRLFASALRHRFR